MFMILRNIFGEKFFFKSELHVLYFEDGLVCAITRRDLEHFYFCFQTEQIITLTDEQIAGILSIFYPS